MNIFNKKNKINLKLKHNVGHAEIDLNKMTGLNNKSRKINNSEKKF